MGPVEPVEADRRLGEAYVGGRVPSGVCGVLWARGKEVATERGLEDDGVCLAAFSGVDVDGGELTVMPTVDRSPPDHTRGFNPSRSNSQPPRITLGGLNSPG